MGNDALNLHAEAGRAAAAAYWQYFHGFVVELSEYRADISATAVAQEYKSVIDNAFSSYYENLFNAAYDQYGIPQASEDADTAQEGDTCARCWCSTCDNLEVCTFYAAADGISPPPCAKCGGLNPPLKRVEDGMPDCFSQGRDRRADLP